MALGEWSLGIEAKAVRPGVVTFVVTNRGKLVHGFEIERRGGDDDDEDEDKFETDDLRPGQSERMTVRLAPGVYEIECSVGDHDDRGMVGTLTVRADAPLLAPPAAEREQRRDPQLRLSAGGPAHEVRARPSNGATPMPPRTRSPESGSARR